MGRGGVSRLGGSFGWKGGLAAEAGALGGSVGSLPGDFGPVLEGEKMVVTACQMGAQYQGEFAYGAGSRERAHFAAAAGAKVPTPCGS